MGRNKSAADSASAYEASARTYLEARDQSSIGREVVSTWAGSLSDGTELLELGCGGGLPVAQALLEAGHGLWAVDSSVTLLARFRERFPDVPVDCGNVLESSYFGRKFGAVIAIGLVFLLGREEQTFLIHRVSAALEPGGRFLFTAPLESGTWIDAITGHECRSLGRERYKALLAEAGFKVVGTYEDEGRNNFYDAEKLAAP